MVIFVDFGIVALLAIVAGGLMAGAAMTATEWALLHLPLITFLFLIKGVLLVGSGLGNPLVKGAGPKEKIIFVLSVLIDAVRSVTVLWIVMDGVMTAFSEGIFHLIVTGFGMVIGVPILIVAAYGPLFISGEVSALGEILSLIAVGVCCLLLYGVFGGW